MKTIIAISAGAAFGAVLIASQAFHWYRIQEMFYFESFHMYGLLGSAIATGMLSIWLLKKFGVQTIQGERIQPKKKEVRPVGNSLGGLFFGLGWGITGACTAPIFILVGWNWIIGAICVLGALTGTLIFGAIQKRLPK